MQADGVIHPHEVAFRDEPFRLIDALLEFDEGELEELPSPTVIVGITQAPAAPGRSPLPPQPRVGALPRQGHLRQAGRGRSRLCGA